MAEPLAHYFDTVPGWFDWPDLYVALLERADDGGHIVEVGGWKGKSASFMGVEMSAAAAAGKSIRFDVVDTWRGSNEPEHQIDPDVLNGRLYDVFLANTAPVRQYVRPIRLTSVEAASTYADASLDAVFLDGDHTTDAVLADLQAWWPKVKPGGTLAGHDRNWTSVSRAVHAFQQFAGVRVRPTSASCWEFRKPVQVTDWSVPEDERAVLVAICSNERSIYRQTSKSLLDCLAGPHVGRAAAAHGFQDYDITWVDKYPSVAAMRDYALMQATLMGASHVLFLDADMTWPKDLLDRMLRHHSVGMVSGVYHLKQWPYWPVLLDRPFINDTPRERKDDETGEVRVLPPTYATEYHYAPQTLKETALQPVSLIGMGCALVPMRVTRAFARPWFEYMPDNMGLPAVTEDVAFCARSRAVGCPIYVDPTVKCGHIGQQVITEPWFNRAVLEMDMLKQLRADGKLDGRGGIDVLFESAEQSGSAA